MNQIDSGWRKRQIALDQKAENARELGLDYEPSKTVIEMAREAGIDEWWDSGNEHREVLQKHLEHFAKLVREDERTKTWTPEHWTEYERSIAAAEREACANICETLELPEWPDKVRQPLAQAIRARIIQSYLEKDNLQLPKKKPQNCGTGYCSCIECVMEKRGQK
jgi:hypothetical protein